MTGFHRFPRFHGFLAGLAALAALAGCSEDTTRPGGPQVAGVEDGAVYVEPVAATFTAPAGETYAAFLDGNVYLSGTPITDDGAYTLLVVASHDESQLTASLTVRFEIDRAPPAAPMVAGVADDDLRNDAVTATFTAPDGETYSATVDGNPYASGETISADGAHQLVVTATKDKNGLQASTTIDFEIDTAAPQVGELLARVDGVTYQLQFSEPVDAAAAETALNYEISGECAVALGSPVAVAYDPALLMAELTLAEPGCVSADDLRAVVRDVPDRAGNPVDPAASAASHAGVGTHLSAPLSAAQEENAPVGVSPTTGGTASLALTPGGLEFAVAVTDLTGPVTNAHIHRGAIGVSGGVAHAIFASFTGTTGRGIIPSANLSETDIRDLLLGDLYVNIHTATNPGGEIRGQIFADRATHLSAALTPDQEVGAVTGAATASGTAALRLTEAGLAFELTVAGLSGPPTAAHFHRGAIGVNGGIQFNITSTVAGNTARGVWRPTDAPPLTSELMKDLLLGDLYLNVHTAANPAGEVRGQVIPIGRAVLAASLDGAQEVPIVDTPARATGAFVLTEAGLVFDISSTGLSGPITAAHFHAGAAGQNGGPVRTITEVFGNRVRGVWTPGDAEPLTPKLIDRLLAGEIYVNLHTAANPGGEIRSQVVADPDPGDGLVASLSGAQENPPIAVAGVGAGVFRLEGRTLSYAITVDGLTGPITAAHFHRNAIGLNGGIAHDITGDFAGNTAAGSVTLSDPDVAELLLGRLYVNVHTAANGSGEIRGQVLLSTGTGLSAGLTGRQERPSVTTAGTGTASAVLTEAGLVQRATVASLAGTITVAHIHGAPIGVNGGVLFALSFADGTQESLWGTMTPDDRQAVEGGAVYFNVHTDVSPSGEIRGQAIRGTR